MRSPQNPFVHAWMLSPAAFRRLRVGVTVPIWLLGSVALVILGVVVFAGCVAVAARNEKRRRDAYRVVRLLGLALIAATFKVYELGWLR
jgi:hypothetical protein